jgi:predicted nuclease of predicted toxin-antitoxin system
MRFLVDAQLPPSLAGWFRERGIAASAVKDVGLRDSDDGSIWSFATQGMWVVITKDEDFVARCIGDNSAPPVVWLRIGNCTNRVLFAWLDPNLPETAARLNSGEKLLEIR